MGHPCGELGNNNAAGCCAVSKKTRRSPLFSLVLVNLNGVQRDPSRKSLYPTHTSMYVLSSRATKVSRGFWLSGRCTTLEGSKSKWAGCFNVELTDHNKAHVSGTAFSLILFIKSATSEQILNLPTTSGEKLYITRFLQPSLNSTCE